MKSYSYEYECVTEIIDNYSLGSITDITLIYYYKTYNMDMNIFYMHKEDVFEGFCENNLGRVHTIFFLKSLNKNPSNPSFREVFIQNHNKGNVLCLLKVYAKGKIMWVITRNEIPIKCDSKNWTNTWIPIRKNKRMNSFVSNHFLNFWLHINRIV